jgi:Tfp pilus assembly protein PilO
MRERGLALAWIALVVLVVVAFGWELNAWRSIASRGQQAASERARLTAEIRQREEEIVAEMRQHAGLLQEMYWSSAGGDPSAFLTRLADLAKDARMRITGVGPLERASTPQFNKSWHTIQVTGPYREMQALAVRVEREKGILEDMLLEGSTDGSNVGTLAPDELRARFKMVALELTADAKRVLERAVAAAGGTGGAAAPALALPVPAKAPDSARPRDPFTFAVAIPGVKPGGPGPAGPPTPALAEPPKPEPVMWVSGIVSYPGGALAIINEQIAKVGDAVHGHRVERILDNEVVMRRPEGGTRILSLPPLTAVAPPAPRR